MRRNGRNSWQSFQVRNLFYVLFNEAEYFGEKYYAFPVGKLENFAKNVIDRCNPNWKPLCNSGSREVSRSSSEKCRANSSYKSHQRNWHQESYGCINFHISTGNVGGCRKIIFSFEVFGGRSAPYTGRNYESYDFHSI